MDVKAIAVKMNVSSDKALSKAAEYVRLLQVRSAGAWKEGEEAKNVCCLDLACQRLSVAFDRKLAARICGAKNDKAYAVTLSSVQNVLGLTSTLTVQSLCIQFGCSQIADFASRVFQTCERWRLAYR